MLNSQTYFLLTEETNTDIVLFPCLKKLSTGNKRGNNFRDIDKVVVMGILEKIIQGQTRLFHLFGNISTYYSHV